MEKLDDVKINSQFESKLFQERAKKIFKKNLINILNYINFQNEYIILKFKHLKYNNVISVRAQIEPCFSDTLVCILLDRKENLSDYKFLNFFIADGYRFILVEPELKDINKEKISFILPEISYDLNSRKFKRYKCKDIDVEIFKSGIVLRGKLVDFSNTAFCIELFSLQTLHQYLILESRVTAVFRKEENIFYSGECEIIRKNIVNDKGKLIPNPVVVLKPVDENIPIFKPKEIRSPRYKLCPLPVIVFKHPLTDRTVTLKVEDISGSGVSVEEYYNDSILLPGLIIPELEIEFTPGFTINCKAQVIYRKINQIDDEKSTVKSGITFLDLNIQDQAKLSSFLHRAKDDRAYVCNRVDLDALWEFFFDTGFFYAEKYAFLQSNKEEIKKIYQKLYFENPHIARHFIYQDKGKIVGHISMLRLYEKTWLFHHHASRSINLSAGLSVLDQISRYVNDFYHMNSTSIDFIICYFRPNNKFPARVFGGFQKELNNLKGCSIDNFGYFNFRKNSYILTLQPYDLLGWKLNKSTEDDLSELENFYKFNSGGLLLDALDLKPEMINVHNLNFEYEKAGFKRKRKIYSLKKNRDLIAIISLTISETGLNLSNLANCIHIIVMKPELLNDQLLYFTVFLLSKHYDKEKIPVLIYPLNYFEFQPILYKKVYSLWILNPKYSDEFLKYLRKWIRNNEK
ncbi:MAG: PilZ domain-containing protein [Thermodesulfovibrio sp.]|uniref:PilZ domain-containing protein n=1 Tax=unclassified Thermodesulfovibrio TaxID=2645936 RepID=UPI00083B51AF|nr:MULTISPECIES: PilZ domain-containing protein [unclassified Thermodesulfovibrio]MDI1472725.1 PilZ domain-containing protein [Thermodesulfovibrio sp. 1176]MDI6713423.1 PilZ domain-containing protein [Thermodesulfovibrio sp.]ODA44462.1 type IV pilus assembly PilZ [Thermodesulfovibrio sp. N1]